MRVAFISVHGCPLAPPGQRDTGGMNVYLREAARELGRRGVCVDIYTRRHALDEPQVVRLGENARVIHIEGGLRSESKYALFNHLPDFTRNLAAFKEGYLLSYDLLHSHYWLSGPVALSLREQWHVPVVTSLHSLGKVQQLVRVGHQARQRIGVEGRVVREADFTIAGSPSEREHLLRLYGADPEKTHVIPCGYDRELFRPINREEARRRLGLTASKIVLFVGRMEPVKGADILLRAVGALEDREGLQIIVIGGRHGDLEIERLRRLAQELGIADCLLFLGSVKQGMLPLYYSAADVCVVPSYYETFGMVAVEAMACGTPVIAARVGGLQATIVDGKTGYLVPWHCPEPYAERLEILLGNEVLRASLGKAARASVEGLTWFSVADRLMEVYGLALGERRELLQVLSCA